MTFEKLINLILESPELMDGEYNPFFNDTIKNTNFCKNLSDQRFKKEGIFENYNVWALDHVDQIIYIFTDIDDCSAQARVSLKPRVNQTITIWKHKNSEKGLMLKIFLNFLLKRFPFISCSHDQYELGKQFWIKLTNYCIMNGYHVVMVNPDKTETEFNSQEEFKQMIDNIWSDFRVTIKIYAK